MVTQTYFALPESTKQVCVPIFPVPIFPLLNRVPLPPPNTVDQIFVLDVQSKQIEQLTTDGLNHAARSWSPDNLSIVCIAVYPRTWAEYRAPRAELYAIDVATRQRRPLASPYFPVGSSFPSGVNGGPLWSPDGARIAYLAPTASYGHNTVFVVPAGGGALVDAGRGEPSARERFSSGRDCLAAERRQESGRDLGQTIARG
ncbi:MAG: hypothetical protein ABSH28_00890 [Acidobacteriota bacterium]